MLLEELNNSYTAPACMNLAYDEIVLVTPSDHLIKDEKC
jgi:mannose-1-phosphate guanylyltransferase